MVDHLKTKCEISKIHLRYNYNKRKLLSVEIRNNQPILRAQRMFQRAPEHVANAIINYYKVGSREHLDMIISFITEISQLPNFNVVPPEDVFLEMVNKENEAASSKATDVIESSQNDIKATDTKNASKGKKPDDLKKSLSLLEDNELKEADIRFVMLTDFSGNKSRMKPEDSIDTSSNAFIELDIVINGL